MICPAARYRHPRRPRGGRASHAPPSQMVLTLLEVARILAPPVALLLTNYHCRVRRAALVGKLQVLRKYHNASMCLYSMHVFMHTTAQLLERHDSWHSLVCDSKGMPPINGWELSKLIEHLDVVLVYASGRLPSMLLLAHHATAPMAVAVNVIGRSSPTPLYFVASTLNAGVHTVRDRRARMPAFATRVPRFYDCPFCSLRTQLMYGYYGAPRLLRPLKMLITLLQLCQHGIVLTLLVAVPAMDDCGELPHGPYMASIVLYGMYFIMFADFFLKTYGTKSLKPE